MRFGKFVSNSSLNLVIFWNPRAGWVEFKLDLNLWIINSTRFYSTVLAIVWKVPTEQFYFWYCTQANREQLIGGRDGLNFFLDGTQQRIANINVCVSLWILFRRLETTTSEYFSLLEWYESHLKAYQHRISERCSQRWKYHDRFKTDRSWTKHGKFIEMVKFV